MVVELSSQAQQTQAREGIKRLEDASQIRARQRSQLMQTSQIRGANRADLIRRNAALTQLSQNKEQAQSIRRELEIELKRPTVESIQAEIKEKIRRGDFREITTPRTADGVGGEAFAREVTTSAGKFTVGIEGVQIKPDKNRRLDTLLISKKALGTGTSGFVVKEVPANRLEAIREQANIIATGDPKISGVKQSSTQSGNLREQIFGNVTNPVENITKSSLATRRDFNRAQKIKIPSTSLEQAPGFIGKYIGFGKRTSSKFIEDLKGAFVNVPVATKGTSFEGRPGKEAILGIAQFAGEVIRRDTTKLAEKAGIPNVKIGEIPERDLSIAQTKTNVDFNSRLNLPDELKKNATRVIDISSNISPKQDINLGPKTIGGVAGFASDVTLLSALPVSSALSFAAPGAFRATDKSLPVGERIVGGVEAGIFGTIGVVSGGLKTAKFLTDPIIVKGAVPKTTVETGIISRPAISEDKVVTDFIFSGTAKTPEREITVTTRLDKIRKREPISYLVGGDVTLIKGRGTTEAIIGSKIDEAAISLFTSLQKEGKRRIKFFGSKGTASEVGTEELTALQNDILFGDKKVLFVKTDDIIVASDITTARFGTLVLPKKGTGSLFIPKPHSTITRTSGVDVVRKVDFREAVRANSAPGFITTGGVKDTTKSLKALKITRTKSTGVQLKPVTFIDEITEGTFKAGGGGASRGGFGGAGGSGSSTGGLTSGGQTAAQAAAAKAAAAAAQAAQQAAQQAAAAASAKAAQQAAQRAATKLGKPSTLLGSLTTKTKLAGGSVLAIGSLQTSSQQQSAEELQKKNRFGTLEQTKVVETFGTGSAGEQRLELKLVQGTSLLGGLQSLQSSSTGEPTQTTTLTNFGPTGIVDPPVKTPKIRILVPPPLGITRKSKLKSAASKLKAYDVYVKRQGRFRKVADDLPKGRALKRGSDITQATIASTFKIKRDKKAKPRISTDIPFRPDPKVFRRHKIVKGKRAPLPKNTYIERKTKRLTTQGALRDILSARGKRRII